MEHALISPDDNIQPGQQQLAPIQHTDAQQVAQPWWEALLSAAPVDEAEAEAHLCQAYRAAGLEPPPHIRWFDSPLAFGRACLVPESEQSIWNDLRDGTRAAAWNTRWNGVRERVWSSVLARVQQRAGPGAGAPMDQYTKLGHSRPRCPAEGRPEPAEASRSLPL